MQPVVEYFSVMLASTFKFVGGPIAGMTLGLNILETTLCSAAGMMLTVSLITYGTDVLEKFSSFRKLEGFFQALAKFYIIQKIKKYFSKPKTAKKFTRTNRLAVSAKRKMGLWGVALLTPFLLTPVFGTIIALSFRFSKQEIMQKMLVTSIVAGFIQTLAIHFVGRIF